MDAISGGDRLSVVITDSGLGGLSICADIVRNLESSRAYKDVKLIYFNAWPEQNRGYNDLPGMAARVRVFDNALTAMERFEPGLILIACNTLSALYGRTEFSRRAACPVAGIIDFGVEMIGRALIARPEARAVIFGTPTTIEAGAYKAGLTARGIPGERLIPQPCAKLAGEIEKGPESDVVRGLIGRFAGEAAAKAGPGRFPILAALCCTHYEYSLGLFKEALERSFEGPVTVLDPNKAMSSGLFPAGGRPKYPAVRIDCRVVSRIRLGADKVAAISGILEKTSPETAAALRDYRHDPGLFSCGEEEGGGR